MKKTKFENQEFYIPNKAEVFAEFEFKNWNEFPDDVGFSHHNYGKDLFLKKLKEKNKTDTE